jgi:putative hydrolase of the HAD superfamily
MDKTIKAILWDADGVVLKPRDKYFSDRLREDYGLDVPQYKILPFFTNEYKQIVIGKANIKDELQKYISDWGWQDTVEELLQYWFSYENKINQDILNLVASLRQAGTKCYIASDHSKYRADDLMKNVSMNQYFDGGLFSCDLGTTKDKPEFFSKITHQLKLKPEQILFIDDEQENIDAAHQAGIRARFFRSVRSLIEDLGQLGFNDLQNLDNKIKDDIGNVQKAGGVVLKKKWQKIFIACL